MARSSKNEEYLRAWLLQQMLGYSQNVIVRIMRSCDKIVVTKCDKVDGGVRCRNTLPRSYIQMKVTHCRKCVVKCRWCGAPVDHGWSCYYVGYARSSCGKFVYRGDCSCDVCESYY